MPFLTRPRTPASALEATAQIAANPIKVPSYYDKIHQAAWIGRTSGLWAGAGMGALIGGGIGAAASFLPYVFGVTALPSFEAVGVSAALTAGVGIGLGTVIFPDVAVTSSAVAAGFEERERRDKIEKLKSTNPELAAALEKQQAEARSNEKEELTKGSLLSSLWRRVNKYYNVKIGLAGIAAGAVLGLVMAAHPDSATILLQKGLNLTPGGAGFVAASAGVMGMMGSIFGLKMSLVSNIITNFCYQVLSGKIFVSAPRNPHIDMPLPSLQPPIDCVQVKVPAQGAPELCEPGQKFTDKLGQKPVKHSYRDMVMEQQLAKSADIDAAISLPGFSG